MPALPRFTPDGLLPPGDHVLTIDELRGSFLVLGPAEDYPHWDAGWRSSLVGSLEILVKQLWELGVTDIFIDGSFVEDKDHPNDIDGYFVCTLQTLISGDLERDLNLLDPHKAWTWDPGSRRPHPGSLKRELPMWHRYRVELYPHAGQSSGLLDDLGNELEFPAAFRRSRRDGKARGIVKIGRTT